MGELAARIVHPARVRFANVLGLTDEEGVEPVLLGTFTGGGDPFEVLDGAVASGCISGGISGSIFKASMFGHMDGSKFSGLIDTTLLQK